MYSTLFLILLHYTVVYFSYLGNYKLCEGRVFICLMKKSINEYYVIFLDSIYFEFYYILLLTIFSVLHNYELYVKDYHPYS